MLSILRAVTLLLGLCDILFGQSAPLKGGLLTNQPIPAGFCAKVADIGNNGKETFILAKNCTGGAVQIWRSVNNGSFGVVVSESDFSPFRLLSTFPDGTVLKTEYEVRPDGLYFTLMSLQSNGLVFDSGSGGSYRIKDGKLEKTAVPGDTITYTDTTKNRRTVQVKFASLPFPKNGGGEFIFMKVVTSSGANTQGIFVKKGTEWYMFLPFFVRFLHLQS